MELTKREALEKHRELWLKVAEMTREQGECVRKGEALEELGYDPKSIYSQCFCCEYTKACARAECREATCADCPVKWPGPVGTRCTESIYDKWDDTIIRGDVERAAELAEQIAHLADEPLKELGKMEKKFTKSDLRTGDVVVLRNGYEYMVLRGCAEGSEVDRFVGIGTTSEWEHFNVYNEDMTSDSEFVELDIVKVFRPKDNHYRPWENREREMDTVFIREEVKELTVAEISKLLGYDVKVVK